jgi:hypothetical protein
MDQRWTGLHLPPGSRLDGNLHEPEDPVQHAHSLHKGQHAYMMMHVGRDDESHCDQPEDISSRFQACCLES